MKNTALILIFLLSLHVKSVDAQVQINLGASGYGYAVNKDELYFDPFGEYSSYYKTSKYVSLGVGFLHNQRNYIGLETSLQQSIFEGSSHNPFPDYEPTEWEERYSKYTSNNYSMRFGFRYTHIFFPSNRFSPIVSASLQFLKEFSWIEKGETKYFMATANGIDSKVESYRREYPKHIFGLSYDLRAGGTFSFNDHFSISLALEISSGLTTLWRTEVGKGPLRKYELAIPLTLHYQF